MTDREKLIALMDAAKLCPYNAEEPDSCADCKWFRDDNCTAARIADYLIANGVVVRECGEWHPDGTFGPHHMEYVFCSVCHRLSEGSLNDKFCPNCGADMRKGDNDG